MVCPDAFLGELDRFVNERRQRWGVTELHARSLTPGRRLHVCRFIARSPLELLVQATDSALVTTAGLTRWREAQAATLRRNLQWYRRRGGDDAQIEEWMTARARRSELSTRISDSEFVQAMFLVDLIHAALQRSLLAFRDAAWAAEFAHFEFMLDGKLPGKLGAGEKLLESVLVPFLGGDRRFELVIDERWKEQNPPHPFIVRYERSSGWSGAERRRVEQDVIDIKEVFASGLRFEPSHDHTGLQIADLVAYVVRWAMREPGDWQAQEAYNLLRPALRGHRRDGAIAHLPSTPRTTARWRPATNTWPSAPSLPSRRAMEANSENCWSAHLWIVAERHAEERPTRTLVRGVGIRRAVCDERVGLLGQLQRDGGRKRLDAGEQRRRPDGAGHAGARPARDRQQTAM